MFYLLNKKINYYKKTLNISFCLLWTCASWEKDSLLHLSITYINAMNCHTPTLHTPRKLIYMHNLYKLTVCTGRNFLMPDSFIIEPDFSPQFIFIITALDSKSKLFYKQGLFATCMID